MTALSAPPIQLLVGLANPNDPYAPTRHNVGAWFIDRVAAYDHLTLQDNKKRHWRYARRVLPPTYHLLIPTVFMNINGQVVESYAHYYQIHPETILIAHDDIDLPVGTIRLKFAGGDGGHNGLKNVINQLNTKKFYRLRVGIGHPGHRDAVTHYVLSAPPPIEREQINAALERATNSLPLVLAGKMEQAMQLLHTDVSR